MTSLKRMQNLLDINETIKLGKRFSSKLSRALLYKEGKYKNPMPSRKEADDLDFRLSLTSQWDALNQVVRGIEPKNSDRLSPLLSPFFSELITGYSSSVEGFNMLKKYLADQGENNPNYDPSVLEGTPDWCVSRLMDLTRSLVSNVDRQLSYSTKDLDVSEGNLLMKQTDKKISAAFNSHFRSLQPILKNMNDPEKNIVNQIKSCAENDHYTNIFRESMRGSRTFVSPNEFSRVFNQFIQSGLSIANSIQSSLKTDVGSAIYKSFLQK